MKLIILLMCFPLFAVGQTSEDEFFEQIKQQRERMFKEISKMLDDDLLMQDSFFGDDFFGGLGIKRGSSVSVDQTYEDDGSISVYIKAPDKNTQLDIQTTDSAVVIKSEVKITEENEQEGSSSRFYSSSSSSQSIAIPEGYVAQAPEKTKDGLRISLVPTGNTNIKKSKKTDSKVPIGKRPGEETI